MPLTLARLRSFAVRRAFPAPTTLGRALARLGFVQADPIRAPARAQDLTLRQRVTNYRAGDLERRYPRLAVEEDFFVNYGFVTPEVQALLHPRANAELWNRVDRRKERAVLDFIRERGVVHPREVDEHFQHGRTTNWFGGTSRASTQLLDGMHYRGLLRVARRDGGTRMYAVRTAGDAALDPDAALDAFIDVIVAKYAPLPNATLGWFTHRVRYAAPGIADGRHAALKRAKARLSQATVDGVDYFWPADERAPARTLEPAERVRLLAPFDPLVWDRTRFEQMFGWAYRFEAYTPAAKRVRGYYALPLLWRDTVIGWANVSAKHGTVSADLGYVSGKAPRERAYKDALDAELAAMTTFLGATDADEAP
jgi:uncharacterized protein